MSERFISTLPEGRQRFIAQLLVHGMHNGIRTPEDFLRHFPAAAIMGSLSGHPELRAKILVPTTGTKEKVAQKKSAASAAEDLQIALDEGLTDASEIVAFYAPDDRVQYLKTTDLWAYIIESHFWESKDGTAKEHLVFILECALENELLTHRDIVEGITVAEIVERFPKEAVISIIKTTLEHAEIDAPFNHKDLLGVTSPKVFVERIPLPDIWQKIIVPKIATAHEYVALPKTIPPQPAEETPAPPQKEAPPQPAGPDDLKELFDSPKG